MSFLIKFIAVFQYLEPTEHYEFDVLLGQRTRDPSLELGELGPIAQTEFGVAADHYKQSLAGLPVLLVPFLQIAAKS
jgi:hypothetical protein